VDGCPEIDFLRELLNACSLGDDSCFERAGTSSILDQAVLEELNGSSARLVAAGEEEGGKASRTTARLLFDSVNEMLAAKCAYYLDAGYGSWFTGTAVLRKLLTPEEMYKEMGGSGEKVAEESMVDELVYREMGGPWGHGSWVELKEEAFGAGRDVADALLEALVDEALVELVGSGGTPS
jgi:hypothetical protein